MEIEQMALEPLELLPSPSRLASTSDRQTSPEPHVADPHTQQVSSLIVGCSTSSNEQPVVMQQGDLKAYGKVTAQSYHIMSDRRLKEDILPLDIDAVAFLGQLNIVQYKWVEDPQGERQIGVIAQDVEQVLAGAVKNDSATNLKSVKLELLQFLTTRAVQHFLPLLTKLDEQDRLGLPLLMRQAAAQQSTTSRQENLSAGTQCSKDMSDSESECETHMPTIGELGLEHSSGSSDCHGDVHPSSSNSSTPPGFQDDAAMVAHILAALGEDNKGMPVIALKLLRKLGKDAVWSTFLEAQNTRLRAADGKMRSPGSTFLHLLKIQEQQAKIA